MNDLQKKLLDLLSKLDETIYNEKYDIGILTEVRNKLKLYIKRFFKDNTDYKELIDEIDINPMDDNAYSISINQLRSAITAMIEDIQISDNDLSIVTENDRQEILAQARKEVQLERERIEIEAREIQKLNEDLKKRTENILLEEEKLNSFKTKLEFADKGIDFQTDAKKNKTNASIWTVIFFILLSILVLMICNSINCSSTFSSIAKDVNKSLRLKENTFDKQIISNTIYISYSKIIFSRLFLYSLLVYSIRFSVRNYNAQMHNFIINSHKANSLKSTLSLLNTAKSDEGNDKLLVQATQAIFSHQNSGFNNKESEPNSPNLITNIIDSVSKKV
ncbi:hypothetical protein [Flavobacterium johnsoniae]|uniref:hypothetical protein n=1 Tax=Flavobacterium johnsoniae TaxID=986 RepID=UPI003D96CFB1